MISTVSHASQSLMPFVLGMTIMVGVILVSYLLCTLPAIVVQELHSRGRSFDRVTFSQAGEDLFEKYDPLQPGSDTHLHHQLVDRTAQPGHLCCL